MGEAILVQIVLVGIIAVGTLGSSPREARCLACGTTGSLSDHCPKCKKRLW